MKRIADTVSVVQMCKVCHVFHHFCNFASVASAFLRAEKIQTILEIDLARYDKKQIEKKNWRKSKNQKFTVAWRFYTLKTQDYNILYAWANQNIFFYPNQTAYVFIPHLIKQPDWCTLMCLTLWCNLIGRNKRRLRNRKPLHILAKKLKKLKYNGYNVLILLTFRN